MVKKIFTFCLFLALGLSAYAQEFSSRMFHKGWLVTEDQDTLRGNIKYDMESNTVQVIAQIEKVNTFSSKKILYFEIYDTILKTYRQFYSIPYQVEANYKTPILFEVLYEGKTSLLARERIVLTTDPYSQAYFNGPASTSEKLVFTYYFVEIDGKMTMYNGKKNHLFEILYKNADKVKAYVRDNRLKTDEMRDIVRITAFYNSL
ncbi:hypothetical protein N7E81_15505 [Reichenbachiella carrageenanivorans]|uniref:Uncharacterized protein n=1 Tax=Reichenbachiella carrageenanivorans TaxID=2979869 RepID=A0ABY6CXW4_9BACT|nr:hypothetical protein [Reichenbachiella carrageenanivorans]UXX78764.1 hypothetical protein N7E81_15505 [Reichenbachiella carrageenanivorans]